MFLDLQLNRCLHKFKNTLERQLLTISCSCMSLMVLLICCSSNSNSTQKNTSSNFGLNVLEDITSSTVRTKKKGKCQKRDSCWVKDLLQELPSFESCSL